MKSRMFPILILTAMAIMVQGCVMPSHAPFEYRYRIFYATDAKMVKQTQIEPEQLTQFFELQASVKRTLEIMAGNGFELYLLEPIPWGRGAFMFKFRRPVDSAESKMEPPPADLTGVFEADGSHGSVYYILIPVHPGYQLHVVGPEGTQTIETRWDGRRLIWEEEGAIKFVALAENPRYLNLAFGGGPSVQGPEWVPGKARRVSIIKRDTPEQRELRKYLQRIQPAWFANDQIGYQ